MRHRSLLLLSCLTGCSGGGSGSDLVDSGVPDHPAVDGGGLETDAARDDAALPHDDSPITTRPSQGAYQCRVERDRTDHSPRSWNMTPPSLVAPTAGTTFLARLESMPSNPVMPAPAQLLVSTFDVA